MRKVQHPAEDSAWRFQTDRWRRLELLVSASVATPRQMHPEEIVQKHTVAICPRCGAFVLERFVPLHGETCGSVAHDSHHIGPDGKRVSELRADFVNTELQGAH